MIGILKRCGYREGPLRGAALSCDFRTFQVYPKALRALPGHPEPAVSWHSGFRGGAHVRPKTTPVHHAARRRGGGVAARDTCAAWNEHRAFDACSFASRIESIGRSVGSMLVSGVWLQGRSRISRQHGTVRVAQKVVPNLRKPTDYLVYLRGSEAGLSERTRSARG